MLCPQCKEEIDHLLAGLAVQVARGLVCQQQSGADSGAAGLQGLIGALMGGRVDPLQTGSPRAAAGGLMAQTLLKALMGQA